MSLDAPNGDRAPLWPGPTEAEVSEVRATQRGELHWLRAGPEVMIIRLPTPGEYKHFREMIFDEAKRSRALEQLARDCVVWPNRQTFGQLLDRWPAMAEPIADHVLKLGRQQEELESKPL